MVQEGLPVCDDLRAYGGDGPKSQVTIDNGLDGTTVWNWCTSHNLALLLETSLTLESSGVLAIQGSSRLLAK